MDDNRFWEIVYPYICSIVRVNVNNAATDLKERIENMPNLILNKHDPMYEEYILTNDQIWWIITRIYTLHISLAIGKLPDEDVIHCDNGLYYRDEVHKLPRIVEESLKRTLQSLHKFAAVFVDPAKHKIIAATATPIKNMNDEINDLIGFISP